MAIMGSRTKYKVTMHDIHLAIKLRSLDNVREVMLRDLTLDVNQSLFGSTALSLSLYYNCNEAFDLLLHRHIQTSTVDLDKLSYDPQKRLEPALVTAVRLGNKAAMVQLLDCGANIEVTDGFGHTALWTAARERRFSIAVTLLCRGATVRPSTRSASLPVFTATRLTSRRTDLSQLLILAGADDYSHDGPSLLGRMLAPGRYSVIHLLLSACHVSAPWPWRHGSQITHIPATHDTVIDNLLQEYFLQPASLQTQCRWTIRRVIGHAMRGRYFLSALSQLPLPQSLLDYLSLVDVLAEDELATDSWITGDWMQLIKYMISEQSQR